jgi:hypothetical protein
MLHQLGAMRKQWYRTETTRRLDDLRKKATELSLFDSTL